MTDCSIDPKNLRAMLDASAQIGATPNGGLRRLTLTPEDKAVRDLLQLADTGVRFVEPRPLDMESALLALARGVVA